MLNFKKYISKEDRGLSIVCHRTLWGKYPENSIAGIRNAIDSNFSIVEIDIRKNIDGDFFLMHDEDLKRTTNILGEISNTPTNIIKNAFLKNGNGENGLITDENIPSLIDVLNMFKGKVLFDIDVKNQVDRESLLTFIHDNNFQEFVDVKKPLESLNDAKEHKKEIKNSQIINMIVLNLKEQSLDEVTKIIELINPEIVEINFNDISMFERVCNISLKNGSAIWVNTLDDVPNGGFTDTLALNSPNECWGYLISKGVSLIQTDYPKVLQKWLNLK